MRPRLGAAIRMKRHETLRSLASRAGGRSASARALPAFLARRLQGREDRLFAALGGAMSFQILRAAYDVGLFALLHERPGVRRAEIEKALGLAPYPTEILLLGLVPLRLVERIEDRYYNDPILSGLLAGKLDGGGLGKILDYFQEVINPAMIHFGASIREGRPVGLHHLFGEDAKSFYAALGESERYGACFEEAMQADTRLNRDRVARIAAFAGSRRILDVGGNSGELALAIAAQNPEVRITVLDFPEAAARARARFHAEGLSDRLDAIGGDLREMEFPPGYDRILFAHFLDIFSPREVQRFLERAFASLPEGGAVTVFGSVMNDDETGPLTYGVLSAYFLCLADGRGRFYTARQITEAMRESGFVDVEKIALPRNEVVLSGEKARGHRDSTSSKIVAFIRLGRPKFLVYSLLLYTLGSAAAVHEGRAIHLARWIHGLGFVWCAHLMTHYCNEFFDLSADAANPAPTRWTGGSRVLVEGRLAPSVGLVTAFVLLFASLALALTMPGGARGIAVLVVALSWFYTAPPLALNYRGLGEVTVATVLNLGVPIVAFVLQRGAVLVPPALGAAVFPLFVAQAARMLVMNLSDYDGDLRAGKRTLAVVLGPRRARWAIAGGQVALYAAIVVLSAARLLPLAAGAAMLATVPISVWQTRRILSGALSRRREAEGVVFWASTHVAILAAAATLGLIASAPPGAAAQRAWIALCSAILAAFVAIVAMQVRNDLRRMNPR